MAQLPLSINVLVLVLLSWSEASPIKSLPLIDSSAVQENVEKVTTDNLKVLLNKNAITESDAGKLKEKQLFDFDPSSFIKLKGYKLIPRDSSKSHIMKILFPRRKSTEVTIKTNAKKVESKSDESIISSIHNHPAKNMLKDSIEVDDILLVRDPLSIDTLLKNELSDEDSSTSPVMNKSLQLQKTGKESNVNRFLQQTSDRELVKREDSAKEAKNEENLNESSTVVVETSLKVESPSQTDESEKKDNENVEEAMPAVQDDVQATSTTESVAPSNVESATVPTDSLKDDTQPIQTESVVDVTEKVDDSQAANEPENKDEPSLRAFLQSDSATQETPSENIQPKVEESQDQTEQPSNADSVKSDDKEDGMVGSPLQTDTVQNEAEDSKVNEDELVCCTNPLGAAAPEPVNDASEATKDDTPIATTEKSEMSEMIAATEAPKAEPKEDETIAAPLDDSPVSATEKATNEANEADGSKSQIEEVAAAQQVPQDSPVEETSTESVKQTTEETQDQAKQVSDDIDKTINDEGKVAAPIPENGESEASESKSENEESVGEPIQATEANVEVSATEKPEEIQLNNEPESPKAENSDVVSAPLETPSDDIQTPVTEKSNDEESKVGAAQQPTEKADAVDSVTEVDTTKAENNESEAASTAEDATNDYAPKSTSDIVSETTPKPDESSSTKTEEEKPSNDSDASVGAPISVVENDDYMVAQRQSQSESSSSANGSETSASEAQQSNQEANQGATQEESRANNADSQSSSSSASSKSPSDASNSEASESQSRSEASSQSGGASSQSSQSKTNVADDSASSAASSSASDSTANSANSEASSSSNSARNSQSSSSSAQSSQSNSATSDAQQQSGAQSSAIGTQSSASGAQSSSSAAQSSASGAQSSASGAQSRSQSRASSQNARSQSEQSTSNGAAAKQVDQQSEQSNTNQNSANAATTQSGAAEQSNANSAATRTDDSVLSRIFSFQCIHPLLSRILLGAAPAAPAAPAARPAARPIQAQLQALLNQQRARLAAPLFKFQAPLLRKKKHVKRAAEDEVFVTPKAFEPRGPSTTRRPTLFERYHAMSSDERVEKASRVLEKIMHGVTIAGHIDGYLTQRAKASVKKVHKMFATSEEI